jgi:hypothetical protein
VTWNVTVPAGVKATVNLPAKASSATPGVQPLRQEKDAVVYTVGSGKYSFAVSE